MNMKYGFMKVASAIPAVRVGDVIFNTQKIEEQIILAEGKGVEVITFPELSLTGYTCQDLFRQQILLEATEQSVMMLLDFTRKLDIIAIVGAPVVAGDLLLNCAIVIQQGQILGIVPKTYLPNYSEFYEKRWFASAQDLREQEIRFAGHKVKLTPDVQLFRTFDGFQFGVEICEDLWTPVPPSSLLALAGAEVLVNLSASNETIGKAAYRRNLVKHQSAALTCVYAYASAGAGESSQDLIFSGQCLIAQNGQLLGESQSPIVTEGLLIRDCDLGAIRADRRKKKSFGDNAALLVPEPLPVVPVSQGKLRSDGKLLKLQKLPFVPEGKEDRMERCMEIFRMQVAGLKRRLEAIGSRAVVGISGGLDSTLALLVTVEAMRQLGRPASEVYGVTMPCYGTSDRTYRNSLELMEKLGVSCKEVNIRQAVDIHFRDIGHDKSLLNGTYENAQARERTQILMDYASVVGGIVIGTGDLSELALGWCTYNGDHMSMYGVNASIPKTLIRWMIAAIADSEAFAPAKAVLEDILDTPISPELLPPDESGKISQYTEDLVGPYALHDFFLYYMLRFGFAPRKIFTLACRAFEGDFDRETVKKWLKAFYRRFFTQQFKRSCLPDGVKVGSVCLSPRGDWRMPSDAVGRIWLQEVEQL
mgnify:CR=1 FL=1